MGRHARAVCFFFRFKQLRIQQFFVSTLSVFQVFQFATYNFCSIFCDLFFTLSNSFESPIR